MNDRFGDVYVRIKFLLVFLYQLTLREFDIRITPIIIYKTLKQRIDYKLMRL